MIVPVTRRRGFTLYELLTLLAFGSLLFALFLPAIGKGRLNAVRQQSRNNLKNMCLAMHGCASRNNGAIPPSIGVYPEGSTINATIFFHMLPDIEQDNVYKTYMDKPTKVPETLTIKTYLCPFDPSCVKENTALTSYASNANIFGIGEKDTLVRYPSAFNQRGTSNTILFMERYAKTGTKSSHYWYDTGATRTYVYPPAKGDDPWTSIVNPQFGVTFDSTDPAVIDDTAHSFTGMTLDVGLGDGSARSVTPAITKTFKVDKIDTDPSVWQWACAIRGKLGIAPTPNGW